MIPPPKSPREPHVKLLLFMAILIALSYLLISLSSINSYITILSQDLHYPQTQEPIENLSFLQELTKNISIVQEPIKNPSFAQEPTKKVSFFFPLCPKNFSTYLPCHDPSRARRFSIERHYRRERHCPETPEERIRCLVPKPSGYRRPFPWPSSKNYAWFKNVPYKRLSEFKKSQNWVRVEGDRLVFPGGGTSFPDGVKGYIDVIRGLVPLESGSIRTVLDVGCGVASFGAFLMNYNILTMSIAPRDIHEAQVQFALERGLPAMVGVLSTHKLPYPSRSFDMAHCSRCLINWTTYDALYLMEIDRVLRPGGYWVLSGPPITSKAKYKGRKKDAEDLQNEKILLEDVSRRLCWKKIAERYPVAIWRKPTNHVHCSQILRPSESPGFCTSRDPDAAWYDKMEPCITRLPDSNDTREISGGNLEHWPKRLKIATPRIKTGEVKGMSTMKFTEDTHLWERRVLYYGTILKFLGHGEYRNVMDMNAGLGGFAAALVEYPVWVMNVVPFDAKPDTLGIVYERGLIGTYMNWCEAFSTYPRTYDLIHANGIFSMYMDKCDIVDILLEMYRILRPEGAVIIRDHVDAIVKVKSITDQMRWKGEIFSSHGRSDEVDKILLIDNSIK